MNLTRRLILSAAALLLLITSVSAKDNNDKKVDYTGTQEVDISVGFPSAAYLMAGQGLAYAMKGLVNIFVQEDNNITPADNTTMLPTFKAEYGYNVLSWLNLGAGVNYSYGSWPMLYAESNAHAWDENVHFTNITFNVKFYWLNRKWVRMYSGVGIGLALCSTNAGAEDISEAGKYTTLAMPAFDLRLIGLTVGQKLYGRFEVGTVYGFVTAGIGYRF